MPLRLVFAVTALLALVAVACGDDGEGDGTATTTTSTTEAPTTTTTEPRFSPPDTTGMDDEAQVRSVVLATARMLLLVDGPDDPALRQLHTGAELERMVGLLRQGEAGGYRPQGDQIIEITSVDILGDRADVFTCEFNGLDTVDLEGNVVRESERETKVVRVLLVKVDGHWKVTDTGDKDSEGNKTPCELQR